MLAGVEADRASIEQAAEILKQSNTIVSATEAAVGKVQAKS